MLRDKSVATIYIHTDQPIWSLEILCQTFVHLRSFWDWTKPKALFLFNRKSPCTLLRLQYIQHTWFATLMPIRSGSSDNNPTGLSILTTMVKNFDSLWFNYRIKTSVHPNISNKSLGSLINISLIKSLLHFLYQYLLTKYFQ